VSSRIAISGTAFFLLLCAVVGAVAFNPTADSYVRDGSSANTNFGTTTPLEVRTSNNGQNRDAYFKLDLSTISGVTLAKLRVNANLSGSGSVTAAAYSVATTTWTETGITWNNKPALGTSLASVSVSGTAYAWYEFDVTSYVQSEQAAGRNVVSFALHATTTSTRLISVKSREAASEKPELVVTGNLLPTVSITSPANGATLPQPATVTINATATDSDGSVTKVEFFQGATKLGEDTTSPYSFTWNDVLAGGYSLTARATDNAAASMTSPVVGLTVTEGGPTLVSGGISTNTTWTLANSPYVVSGDFAVGSPGNPVLTIEPGVVVKFNSGAVLKLGYIYFGTPHPGRLLAVGTAARPIVFTANTASPTAGYWQGIQLFSTGGTGSSIAYAIVKYGGSVSGGGIRIIDSSPSLQNVTSQNNLHSGISCEGSSSPLITASMSTANPVGLYLTTPSAPSLQALTISSNTGFAISLDSKVTLGAVSGITATGNGNNAVEVRFNGIDVNTTWRNVGIPYVSSDIVIGKPTTPYPVLTIEPGVTVKFNAGATLKAGYFYLTQPYPGILQAVGTAALPITFTANTASPTAGYWQGVQFYSSGSSPSRMSYATVRYAGFPGNFGGVHLTNSSPVFDHVRFETNSYAGLSLNGANPIVHNCDFTGNTGGIVNQTPSTVIDARFNWWNAITGPSGSGPGTGQSVSTGAKFEPWLTSAGSAPQFFDTFTLGNSTFNPTLGIHATFTFTTSLSGNWAVRVFNSGDVLIRTLTGSGAGATAAWDGKNESGVPQPDGSYRYQLETAAGSDVAAPLRGNTSLDSARQLAITSPMIAPPFFSPNADAIQDVTVVTGTSTFDGAIWTVNVKNSGGATVRSVTGPANPAISFGWDGRDGGGALQPDGSYTLELVLVDGTASVSINLAATLDVTFPTAAVTYPAGAEVLSNVYQSGQADVVVTGTSSDTNLNNWTLDYGAGGSPGSWTTITTGTVPVINATLATWSTVATANGLYTLRLRVWDKAGNLSTQTRTPTIGNFTVSQSVLAFYSGTGATVTYTSVVPFTLTETLVLKNLAGQTVRTLVATQRAAGTFADPWDGRDAAGILLPEGPYFYSATATDGTNSMTWDLSSQYVDDGFHFCAATANATFEPFNNRLLAIPSLTSGSGPGREWILFMPTWINANPCEYATPAMCGDPGNFCRQSGGFVAPGQSSSPWTGLDSGNVFRTDILTIVVMVDRETFPRNAVVAYGTRPTVTSLTVTPNYYGPTAGQQTVSFFLASFQSQPVTVRLTATNLASRSVLRTKTVTGVAPGMASISWDGRGDDGTWVAPGRYALDLFVTDALGNSATAQTLTVVGY
jgi:flagellar hook assembly protein FlgD